MTASLAGYAQEGNNKPAHQAAAYNYDDLNARIAAGRATIAEVRQALTDEDAGKLTNTMHALYSMRWHRGVVHLLHDMWALETAKYPELAWDLIKQAPVRIALASTISRIQITGTGPYLKYIRSYETDKQEFIRAQVVVALGFNGLREDVSYIKSMADSDDPYVVQAAIASLGFMQTNEAKKVLEDLYIKYRGKPRQGIIEEVLKRVYREVPMERPKHPADGKDK